jgi:glucose/arabinose dehydrogenase
VTHRLPLNPTRLLVMMALMAVTLFACSTPPDETAADPPEELPSEPEPADEPTAEPAGDPPPEEEEVEEEVEAEPLDPLLGLEVEVVAEGLSQPVGLTTAPGDDRLFVTQRGGLVRTVHPDGTVDGEPFLDVGDRITSGSIEQGLLGFTFHPEYPADPRVFAYYSVPSNDAHLVSYEVTDDGLRADTATEQLILVIDRHPERVRHNGGKLLFGPDGYLWAAIGDGAQASVNGQDPATLPGTILRLDVDAGDPYAIPPDNPFVDGGGAPEVYFYGLRNPWRFTIDEVEGLVYIADVGQETVEEVNVVPIDAAGTNFGWPVFEGTLTFYGGEPHSEVTDPVRELLHEDGHCSITGGEVYRGGSIPELDGHYFHGDWCRGLMESFRYDNGEVTDIVDWTEELDVEMPSSFGVDTDGEVLIVDWGAEALLRVVPVR